MRGGRERKDSGRAENGDQGLQTAGGDRELHV
jgi:hypothetical protein